MLQLLPAERIPFQPSKGYRKTRFTVLVKPQSLLLPPPPPPLLEKHCACYSVESDPATPSAVPRQVPLSMGFFRQEYWNRLPCPSRGNLPNPGIEPGSPALQADSLASEPPEKPYCMRWVFNNKTFGDGRGEA